MSNSVILHAGRFKNGAPTFWEKRKDNKIQTLVELIASSEFEPLRPCFLNRDPKIKQYLHMMFVAEIGNFVVRALRNNISNKTIFTLFVITNIVKDEVGHFSIEADELYKSEILEDFTEKFGEEIDPFMDAANEKLDSETIDSLFTQPHKLYEKTAAKNREAASNSAE